MEWPLDLPPEYSHIRSAKTPEELLETFSHYSDEHLVEFLEWIADDKIWISQQPSWIKPLFRWITIEFIQKRFDEELARRLTRTVWENYQTLQSLLFYDLALHVDSKRYPASSLMYGTASSVMLDLLRRSLPKTISPEIGVSKRYKVELPMLREKEFEHIDLYVNTGDLHKLSHLPAEDLITLQGQARTWKIMTIAKMCSQVQSRYLSAENVIDTLVMAQQERFSELKERALDLIKGLSEGIILREAPSGNMVLDISFLSDFGKALINKIASWIVGFHCHSDLLAGEELVPIIKKLTRLKKVDISGSKEVNEAVFGLLINLESLDLSGCLWLTPTILYHFHQSSLHLKQLNLGQTEFGGYDFISVLAQFKELTILNMSECREVDSLNFVYLVKELPKLQEFRLTDNQQIKDQEMVSFLSFCPELQTLELSECNGVTETAFLLIAHQNRGLEKVILRRCHGVTDGVLRQFVHHCPGLRYLDIRQCSVSGYLVEELRGPYLLIEV